MPDKSKKPAVPPVNRAAEKISLSHKLAPEIARKNIKALLLGNPNYFGTMKESKLPAVLKIKGDTTYESIGCVGYNPQLNRLEAEVNIKLDGGYDGGVCTNGSLEYVRFYLSHDGGATWQDQGITSFRVYDTVGPKPLEYDASLQINPTELLCFAQNLPTVRAILSWNVPPPANSPNWPPIWGQVVDTRIQIAGLQLLPLKDLLQEAKLKLAPQFEEAVDLAQPIKAAEAAPLSAPQLAKLYQASKVPGHRYLLPELQKAIATGPALAQTAFGIEGLNLAGLIEAALNTKGDTTFEQLNCVGLNPNIDQLVAILNVKLTSGYSGGPCTAGSKEYVAFWVDWNGAGWIYVGTNSVSVHDYSSIPAGGLQYSVIQPVDMASHRVPCEKGAKTARVRAVLSWNTPPSTVDPYAPVVWGNSHETTILLEPGTPVEQGTADISIIGGIGIAEIDTGVTGLTQPFATFADFGPGEYADPWDHSRQCPFGGMVDVHGQPASGKYRVSVRKVGSTTATILNNPIYPVDKFGVTHTQNPDPAGFFPYLSQDQNQLSLLAYWYSSGDDLWEMMLETDGGAKTPWYRIQLDNTAPKTSAQLVPPTIDIHIDSGGDCKDFDVPTGIDGHFVARDTYFGVWSLTTLPSTITPAPPNPTALIPTTTETGAYPGDPWSLKTDNMTPCGYVVMLQVWDRSIVGSYPGSHNYNHAEVGFCLRAAK